MTDPEGEQNYSYTQTQNTNNIWYTYKSSLTDEEIVQGLISDICEDVKNMLLEKNRKYGNSALEPSRIFSRADPVEQIKVRIDDKLTRLKNQQPDEDEDVEWDLLGYLVLLQVAKRFHEAR